MLRRTESIARKADREPVGEMHDEIERAFGSFLRPAQAEALKASNEAQATPRSEVERAKVDRRQTERRGMDALRAEALRTVISRVEDRNFGGLRNKVRWGRGMPATRVVLVLVALGAGGVAAFLATQRDQPTAEALADPVTEIVQEARVQILVAKEEIGMGQRLSPDSLEWVDWPEEAVRPDYITIAALPEAISSMTGSVARFEFFPGEPIREQKLAQAGQGYLSAVLESGMRAVSVSITAESASGGFIVPNDHVDVVLTRPFDTGQVSETILHNARVLAINTRLGELGTTGAPADPEDPRAEIFADQAIATLQLDPAQAEVIINGSTMGKLSLVLRPIVDVAVSGALDQRATNQAIRISSPFWSR